MQNSTFYTNLVAYQKQQIARLETISIPMPITGLF